MDTKSKFEDNLSDKYSGWEEYYQQSPNRPSWQEDPSPLVKMFMEMEHIYKIPQVHIADYGCGDGRNLWPWVKANTHVTAVDIAPSALKKISEISIQQGLICPTLVCSSMEDMPLGENQFDAAQCLDALPQVWDVKNALTEISKTLKPKGKLLFNVFTPRDCAFGEGKQIEDNAFTYKNTIFRFFEDEDLRKLLPQDLEILESVPETWEDPPHFPFRPVTHTHDGIYYVCQKKGG